MRSVLLVIASCCVVLAAFVGYLKITKRYQRHSNDPITSIAPPPPPPVDPARRNWIKPAESAWVKTFSPQGDLKNRFRADEYQPRDDGTVVVKNPVAEFYMPNRQTMRLSGLSGTVVLPETASGGNDMPHSGAPSRGQLHTCTIEWFNLFPDSVAGVADETIYLDNVQFDNETMLITTESFKAKDGLDVPADQAPVKMRGKKYDFDGRGLRLRWNDKDGRLELLEVAHGEELIIKDTAGMSGTFGASKDLEHIKDKGEQTAGGKSPGGGPASASDVHAPSRGMLAGDDRAALAEAVSSMALPGPASSTAPPAQLKPAAPPVPYIATFYDDLDITQGDELHIVAQRMDLNFTTHKEGAAQTAATARSGDKDAQQVPGRAAGSSHSGPRVEPSREQSVAPAPRDDDRAPAKDVPPGSATRAAQATPASSPPIVIRWTGMLRMEPDRIKFQTPRPGDSVVELTGSPVVVRRLVPGGAPKGTSRADEPQGDDIRAAKVVYHSLDGSATLFNSPTVAAVVMSKIINGNVDPRTAITTEMLDYRTGADGRRIAILRGRGSALMAIQAQGDETRKGGKASDTLMEARWQEGGIVYFARRGRDDQSIEQVDLAGDVDVRHPQMVLQSQALSLYFQPPTAKSAGGPEPSRNKAAGAMELTRMLARELVHCDMAGTGGRRQAIDCGMLEMLTAPAADGRLYARQVNAWAVDDDVPRDDLDLFDAQPVHAYDGQQDLSAGKLELVLRPAHANDAEVDKMEEDALLAAADSEGGAPAPRGQNQTAAVELESLHAEDAVRAVNKDASVATGATLDITTPNGTPHVRLCGSLARVLDSKGNVVSGPVITFEQKSQTAHVLGAGTLHVMQESAGGGKARPMDVVWAERADLDAPADRIDVYGAVAVSTLDADGTRNTASGDHVRVDLVGKPSAANSVANSATQRARGDAGGVQMDALRDKQARTITIQGRDAKVASNLLGPAGEVWRQFTIWSPTIIYQMAAPGDGNVTPGNASAATSSNGNVTAATAANAGGRGAPPGSGAADAGSGAAGREMLIPGAGRMLVRDHRPPAKARTQVAATGENRDESSSRGDTAFEWKRDMVYRESEQSAVMTGDVYIVHQPDGKESADGPMRIKAQRVIAWFASQHGPASTVARTATSTATRPAEAAMALKRLSASQDVSVTRGEATLTASRLDYDPLSHWLSAHGSGSRPAHYEDPDPKRSLTARDIQWNTQTWNVKLSDANTASPR